MTIYASRPRRAEAVSWDGRNTAEVIAFAGEGNALIDSSGRFAVRGSGPGTWRDFSPGDWVIKDLSDGWVHLASPETFKRVWEIQ